MVSGTPPAEIEVSEGLVRGLLAEQHPQYAGFDLNLAGEGWDNFTWRLGETLAVRLPRRLTGVDLLRHEQLHLPHLAPRLPLPVPAPLAVGMPGCGYPWSWSIVPWIEGEPVDHALLDIHQGPVLACFLRALHAPATEDAPVNPGRGVALAVREARVSQCLARLKSSSDLITPALENVWRAALDAPVSQTRTWLHGDLHAQNVLSVDGRLSGVVDWGDMCGGDPAVDLCAVWNLLGDAPARQAALDAYAPDPHLLARAKGWALLFGATLYENGRIDDARHAAIGEATLRRLADDL